MILQSQVLAKVPGILHGFGTLSEPFPHSVFPSGAEWEERKPRWKQVHGSAWVEVTVPAQECGEVDALVTTLPGQPLAVVSADCVPVLLAERWGRAVAAVHAGWRGTLARISEKLPGLPGIATLEGGRWRAAIGPAIGPCCYEVSEELAQQFAAEFADFGPGIAVPTPRHLDLPGINAAMLRRQGVQVEILRACTQCSGLDEGTPKFHSFRREKGGTRQFSAICRV